MTIKEVKILLQKKEDDLGNISANAQNGIISLQSKNLQEEIDYSIVPPPYLEGRIDAFIIRNKNAKPQEKKEEKKIQLLNALRFIEKHGQNPNPQEVIQTAELFRAYLNNSNKKSTIIKTPRTIHEALQSPGMCRDILIQLLEENIIQIMPTDQGIKLTVPTE